MELTIIEHGFKVLKSELEIGPVYHRVMRMRLKAAKVGLSPEQSAGLKARQVKQPTNGGQMTLL